LARRLKNEVLVSELALKEELIQAREFQLVRPAIADSPASLWAFHLLRGPAYAHAILVAPKLAY
jgi:hypothetical protein